MKHLKTFESYINEEFYLGSDEVVGVTFKLKQPVTCDGKTFGTEDTWTIDKAIDDAHYCTSDKGDKEVFHTDIILGDTIMSTEDSAKFH
jgi:hypothetical protein